METIREKDGAKFFIIAVRFSPDQAEILRAKAKEQSLPISSFVRHLIFHEMPRAGFKIDSTDDGGPKSDSTNNHK